MTEPEMFTPVGRRSDLVFRPRSVVAPGSLTFGPDGDGFELLVTDKAAGDIRRATRAAVPNEAFGLLSGRSYLDDHGPYTVVVGAVRARLLASGPGHVRLSGSEMAGLRAEAGRADPAADIVGWWHSHCRPSDYSSTDRAEMATWPSSNHVGLLAFMAGGEALRAYRGPAARRLVAARPPAAPPAEAVEVPAPATAVRRDPAVPVPAVLLPPALEPWRARAELPPPPVPPVRRSSVAGPSSAPTPPDAAPVPAWWLAAILSCGLVVAVLVAVVLTVWAGPGDAPAPGSVDTGALGRRTDWDCATPADLTVRCSGPIGRGITGWHWRFDDGAVADGPTVEHDFDAPGPHAVALVIATPAGSRSAGKRSVEVPDPLVGAGTAAPDAGR